MSSFNLTPRGKPVTKFEIDAKFCRAKEALKYKLPRRAKYQAPSSPYWRKHNELVAAFSGLEELRHLKIETAAEETTEAAKGIQDKLVDEIAANLRKMAKLPYDLSHLK